MVNFELLEKTMDEKGITIAKMVNELGIGALNDSDLEAQSDAVLQNFFDK